VAALSGRRSRIDLGQSSTRAIVQWDNSESYIGVGKAWWLEALRLQHRNAVFVVDDDASVLTGMSRMLRHCGYDSVLFQTAEAFEHHRDFEQAICVVLDINLNDASGIELRHRLRAGGNLIPVIFMTGNDNTAVREAALDSGCVAYLTKPFSAKSLIEPIKKASAEH
jgi:FixJ family two-component response regulator